MKARMLPSILLVLGLWAVAAAPVQAQTLTWAQRPVSGASRRWYTAMVYDSARGVCVLFGGANDVTGWNGETWEWDGDAWTQRVVSGPPARNAHVMAYDSARHVTVLFGGANASTSFHDTWEWNGSAWSQRAVSGPMSGGAMAYDAARGVTVLFGGSTGRETWEWNGTAWTQRATSGPSSEGAMAYDSIRHVSVLFGGASRAETWEWNGTAWTQRVVTGPPGRDSHVMAYDAARGVTVLFSGDNGDWNTTLEDTWEWNGNTWTQRFVSGTWPFARLGHALAYDATRGVTVLFGGRNDNDRNSPYGDTWVLGAGPSITQQPTGQTILSGGTSTLIVAASAPPGGGALTYQWRRNGAPIADGPFGNGSVIHGAGTPSLVITSVALADNTVAFDCIVSNGFGSTTSYPAGLSVTPSCTADFNYDGLVNSNDFFDFLTAFFAGCP